MAKKSEKNENRRKSLRKVKECPKKEAKKTPKQKFDYEAFKAHVALEIQEAENYRIQRDIVAQERIKIVEQKESDRMVNMLLNIGYFFNLEEGILLDFHLRNKIMDEKFDGKMQFCPIMEVNVYAVHPQSLAAFGHPTVVENNSDVLLYFYPITSPKNSKVWYFFTRSRPNENQPSTGFQGHWTFGEKKDVFYQDKRVGIKQVLEYCEGSSKSTYKIIEYQLDPVPDDLKNGLWFVCKLYNDGSCVDVQSGP